MSDTDVLPVARPLRLDARRHGIPPEQIIHNLIIPRIEHLASLLNPPTAYLIDYEVYPLLKRIPLLQLPLNPLLLTLLFHLGGVVLELQDFVAGTVSLTPLLLEVELGERQLRGVFDVAAVGFVHLVCLTLGVRDKI